MRGAQSNHMTALVKEIVEAACIGLVVGTIGLAIRGASWQEWLFFIPSLAGLGVVIGTMWHLINDFTNSRR